MTSQEDIQEALKKIPPEDVEKLRGFAKGNHLTELGIVSTAHRIERDIGITRDLISAIIKHFGEEGK